ncbi:MAG: ABC transporter ATP-binding protein, partial [Acidimicrobiales bacterium]
GALAGDILIDRVSFGYESSKPVLKEVSLTIPAGSQVGIVGPNGSGKSTLLWLLLRFYDPDSGRIAIGGHDLRELDVADIRSAVAFVSQDVYLFDDTLEANLRYGRPDASSDQVAAAVDAAGVAGMLGELPDGLATRLGERGLRLSGGQRQRVALARALLKDAPILALDEATSHLDYEAEAALKTSLRAATSGRTVVLIAHRLSSIRDLDNIVVIDAGRVVEQGSHDDLVAHGGIYRRLWTLQRPQ